MTYTELKALRLRWLRAARVYYLSPGDDSGMDDYSWDYFGRLLLQDRDQFPHCPILSDSTYEGGSLYWVNDATFERALAEYQE